MIDGWPPEAPELPKSISHKLPTITLNGHGVLFSAQYLPDQTHAGLTYENRHRQLSNYEIMRRGYQMAAKLIYLHMDEGFMADTDVTDTLFQNLVRPARSTLETGKRNAPVRYATRCCNNFCPGTSLYILTPLSRNQQFTRKLVRIDRLFRKRIIATPGDAAFSPACSCSTAQQERYNARSSRHQ